MAQRQRQSRSPDEAAPEACLVEALPWVANHSYIHCSHVIARWVKVPNLILQRRRDTFYHVANERSPQDELGQHSRLRAAWPSWVDALRDRGLAMCLQPRS